MRKARKDESLKARRSAPVAAAEAGSIETMNHHACFAVPLSQLDVVIIDESRNMQGILRSILIGMRVRRVRVFAAVGEALTAMVVDPPNLILAEWQLGPITGQRLLDMLRSRGMGPLSFVPVVFLTDQATARLVERAIVAGAHMVLLKPVAPATLIDRIAWICRDRRKLVLGAGGVYEIDGLSQSLRDQRDRQSALNRAIRQRAAAPSLAPLPPIAPPPDPRLDEWQAFLKSRASSVPSVMTRSPDQVLRNLSKVVRYGALRG